MNSIPFNMKFCPIEPGLQRPGHLTLLRYVKNHNTAGSAFR